MPNTTDPAPQATVQVPPAVPQGPGVDATARVPQTPAASPNAPGAPAPAESTSIADIQAMLNSYATPDEAEFTPRPAPAKVIQPVAPPTVPAPPEAPVVPTHSARLLRRAAALGVPAQAAAGMSADDLDDEIHFRTLQAAQIASQAHAPKPPVPPAEPEPEIDWGEHPDPETGVIRKYTDKDIHPAIVRREKAKAKADAARDKENQELRQLLRQKDQQETVGRFDAKFASRPDLFGSKPMRQLEPGSPEALRRGMLLTTLGQLKADPTNFEADFDRYVPVLFPGQVQAPPPAAPKPAEPRRVDYVQQQRDQGRDPVTGQFTRHNGIPVEQWNNGALERPTGREAPKQSGAAAAAQDVAEILRSRGVETTTFGSSEADELPD